MANVDVDALRVRQRRFDLGDPNLPAVVLWEDELACLLDVYKGLREECQKRGLPVSAALLARHERAQGLAIGGAEASAKCKAELARLRRVEQAAREAELEYQRGWSETLDQRMAEPHTSLEERDG